MRAVGGCRSGRSRVQSPRESRAARWEVVVALLARHCFGSSVFRLWWARERRRAYQGHDFGRVSQAAGAKGDDGVGVAVPVVRGFDGVDNFERFAPGRVRGHADSDADNAVRTNGRFEASEGIRVFGEAFGGDDVDARRVDVVFEVVGAGLVEWEAV
ncbi:hypothetical protein MPH_11619 [Macrophomina phaseolina MS6]|uniref:Uncharacterized protein n=1 Tax=Macrophomina phaseolina (strain MS6) TaxID=1126212 RepID=K2S3F7_MACPH|nr:hypothetical protein MPH_11619 [Macrophomina phaseolina MS6]